MLTPSPTDRREMLAEIGAKSVDELFRDVPSRRARRQGRGPARPSRRARGRARLPGLCGEERVAASAPFFIGAGAYRHHVPSTVDYMIQRGEFLTSYTPYQPEITQGTLQYLFEFQTQVDAAHRHGGGQRLDVRRLDRRVRGRADGQPHHASHKALISGGLHPHYRSIIETTAHLAGL
jgi:glycine dehydrogenase subunit 1